MQVDPFDTAGCAPIFLIGLGATSAGDDILRARLTDCPELFLADGTHSTLHATMFRPEAFRASLSKQLRRLRGLAEQRIAMAEEGRVLDDPDPIIGLLSEVGAALTAERHLAAAWRTLDACPGTQVYGEIATECASVTRAEFDQIRETIAAAGFRPRVLLVLQDPVARCLEHVSRTPESFASLTDVIRHPDVRQCLDYRRIMDDLESAVPTGEHLIVLQEEPASQQRDALGAFLGVDLGPAVAPENVNTTQPTQDDIRRVREAFADTYSACNKRFGADRIARLWA